MKAIKLIAIAAMMAAGSAGAYAQNADEIIQKHIDAIGGSKWKEIHSMKMSGGLNVQGMDLTMTQTVVDSKGMRMDMNIMGNACYTIVTPTEGWIYMPIQPGMDKVTPMKPEEVKMSQDKLNVRGMQLADKNDIEKAAYEGIDTVNSNACYKVKITDKKGNTKTAYFDTKTYYMLRVEDKVTMQGQEQEVSLDFSEFKKLPEGITIAMVWGTPQGDVTIKSVEVNKQYPASLFKPDTKK